MSKGVSLYITVVIMAILLAIVLGISAILMSQIKIIKGIENSVIAFHAADTGIERVLKIIMADEEAGLTGFFSSASGEFDNGASYEVEVRRCRSDDPNCNFYSGNVCADIPPAGVPEAAIGSCAASRYCVKSQGTYKGSQRAVEVSYGGGDGQQWQIQRFEYFDIIGWLGGVVGSSDPDLWRAQTFTVQPGAEHRIYSVKLYLTRPGEIELPGLVTASLRETDASGHPAGPDLCCGLTNGNSLPLTVFEDNYEWREIILNDSSCPNNCTLSANQTYAIVLRVAGPGIIRWKYGEVDYTGGTEEISNDSGNSWYTGLDDVLFEEYGCVVQ